MVNDGFLIFFDHCMSSIIYGLECDCMVVHRKFSMSVSSNNIEHSLAFIWKQLSRSGHFSNNHAQNIIGRVCASVATVLDCVWTQRSKSKVSIGRMVNVRTIGIVESLQLPLPVR